MDPSSFSVYMPSLPSLITSPTRSCDNLGIEKLSSINDPTSMSASFSSYLRGGHSCFFGTLTSPREQQALTNNGNDSGDDEFDFHSPLYEFDELPISPTFTITSTAPRTMFSSNTELPVLKSPITPLLLTKPYHGSAKHIAVTISLDDCFLEEENSPISENFIVKSEHRSHNIGTNIVEACHVDREMELRWKNPWKVKKWRLMEFLRQSGGYTKFQRQQGSMSSTPSSLDSRRKTMNGSAVGIKVSPSFLIPTSRSLKSSVLPATRNPHEVIHGSNQERQKKMFIMHYKLFSGFMGCLGFTSKAYRPIS